MGNKLFGNSLKPQCNTCAYGRPAPDEIMILCRKYGPVAPNYHCGRYSYDPLRRVPHKDPDPPELTPEDFRIV